MSRVQLSHATQQLGALVTKAEKVASLFEQTIPCPTKDQRHVMIGLVTKFQTSVSSISGRIQQLESEQQEHTRHQGNKLLSHIEDVRVNIQESQQVKALQSFRKTLTFIFVGPIDSVLDNQCTRSRNKQTRKRLQSIKSLNPDGVISWAVALAPSIWIASSMSIHLFEYLIANAEPSTYQKWPVRMQEVLNTFASEDPLANCAGYLAFLREFNLRANTVIDESSMKNPDDMGIQHSHSNSVPTEVDLSGDVYELAAGDGPRIAEQISGQMWLTDPYDESTQPFVTIPITWKLRDHLISQRPRLM